MPPNRLLSSIWQGETTNLPPDITPKDSFRGDPLSTTCGVFSLTLAAEFALHIIRHLQRTKSAELIYESNKFHQIPDAEERTVPAYDDFWVRSNQVRPLRRNRTYGFVIDPQQEAFSIAVVPLAHAGELFSAEWMEWVRDTYKACQ